MLFIINQPILDKKLLMRINYNIKLEKSDGWNEMVTDGHTSKHETMKYYKNKAKKNFNKRPSIFDLKFKSLI